MQNTTQQQFSPTILYRWRWPVRPKYMVLNNRRDKESSEGDIEYMEKVTQGR
jgi:hypothetical protein